MRINKNAGQGLIEALVALGVTAIIVAAIALTIVTSLNNAEFSKYQNLATSYAQQGMDTMRQKSETNWSYFNSLSGIYCLPQYSDTLISGDCTSANITNTIGFLRKIIIDSGGGCSAGHKVTVSVAWTDSKCRDLTKPYCHAVILDSCLAQINDSTLP